MQSIINTIDKTVAAVGISASWLSFILIWVVCADVFMRYILSTSPNWLLDLEWHIFALMFLMGSAYAYQEDKHVRVDVFYSKYSDKQKAIVDLVGCIFLLIPWCIIVIKTSTEYSLNSWYMREGSAEPGGLPARYIIKSAIVVGFVLLALQAISQVLKNILKLIK